jgi:NAD(P)-dependent dehydrogenase (short-subunit alcohol dehydrogenase family)
MANTSKTVIVTGGSQGIGSGAVQAFLKRELQRCCNVAQRHNLEGFIYMTQLAIKQMLAQKSGGSVVSITHQVEKTAFVAEAGFGGWRHWGSYYCGKSGGSSRQQIRFD